MKSLVVAGYFGCGNLGDDSLLLGFLSGLSSAEYSVTALTGNPEEAQRLYNVRGVYRKDPGSVKTAIQSADALVFVGGSIFQDVTSVKSVLYYSSLVKTAKKCGKRVALLAQGVGPLNTFLGKSFARGAFNAADLVTVRDPDALSALRNLGVRRPVEVTADLAFLLPKPAATEESTSFGMSGLKTVGLALRPTKLKDGAAFAGELCRALFAVNWNPVLIEMDREVDGAFILQIDKAMGGKVPSMRRLASPMQLQDRLSRMDGMIAMRLHGGILAAGLGIPPLMIDYDPKVKAFSRLLDLPAALPLAGLTAQRVVDNFLELDRNSARLIGPMKTKIEELKRLAGRNVELLRETVPT